MTEEELKAVEAMYEHMPDSLIMKLVIEVQRLQKRLEESENRLPKFRCSFGFHRWGLWDDPEPNSYTRQTRRCIDCNRAHYIS